MQIHTPGLPYPGDTTLSYCTYAKRLQASGLVAFGTLSTICRLIWGDWLIFWGSLASGYPRYIHVWTLDSRENVAQVKTQKVTKSKLSWKSSYPKGISDTWLRGSEVMNWDGYSQKIDNI